MKRLIHWAALAAAVVTATVGLVMPGSAAQAQPGFPCPKIIAVCAFTGPGGQGQLRLIFDQEPVISPPIRSAMNNTPESWCFYSAPYFNGPRRQVSPFETVEDFGFFVRSAKPGPCEWQ
jgi:hypothetical protein